MKLYRQGSFRRGRSGREGRVSLLSMRWWSDFVVVVKVSTQINLVPVLVVVCLCLFGLFLPYESMNSFSLYVFFFFLSIGFRGIGKCWVCIRKAPRSCGEHMMSTWCSLKSKTDIWFSFSPFCNHNRAILLIYFHFSFSRTWEVRSVSGRFWWDLPYLWQKLNPPPVNLCVALLVMRGSIFKHVLNFCFLWQFSMFHDATLVFKKHLGFWIISKVFNSNAAWENSGVQMPLKTAEIRRLQLIPGINIGKTQYINCNSTAKKFH